MTRFLTIKEDLPICSLIVILFLEQGVKIRTLQPEMRRHPIRIQFLQLCKVFQLLNLGREGEKVLIYIPCFRNRMTIKVKLGKFSLSDKVLFLQQSMFERTLQLRFHRCNSKIFLTKMLGKKHF